MSRRLEIPGARYQASQGLGVSVPRAIPMPPNAPQIPATIPGVRQNADAAGAVGRMIAGMGNQLVDQGFQAAREDLAFQEQQLKARRAADLSSMKADFASRTVDLELDAAKDPDPVGAPARFLERANQLRSDMSSAQQDPIVRHGFNGDSTEILVGKQRSVKWAAWGREKGMREAQLGDQMRQWAGARAFERDPAAAATIEQQWRQTLADYQQGGWITPEEMVRKDREFHETWQTVQARRMLTDRPAALKAALDQSDTFTGIAPEQRAVFRDMAATREREEQSRREQVFRAARQDELTALRSIVDDQDTVLRAGYPPKWADLSNARVAAARLGDAKLVKRVDEMIEVGNRTAGFGRMTLGEQYRTFGAIAQQQEMTPAEAKSAVALERMIKERGAALKPAIDEAAKLARDGRDPEALDRLRMIVKGSPQEQELEAAVAEGNWKRTFLRATDAEQRQVLDRMNLTGEWSDDKARVADYAKTMLAETVRRRESDALGLARDRGLVELKPLPFNNPLDFSRAIAERIGPARQAQFLFSTPAPQVFTKDEADLFASRLDQAPAEQKVTMLAMLRDSLPPEAFRGIRDAWMAKPETRIYAAAAALAGEGEAAMGAIGASGPGLVTSRVNDTAVRVLQGSEAARKEPRLLPSKVDLDEKLRDHFGNAFAADRTGANYAIARDMVRAHYAWDGQQTLDTSGNFDKERLERAVQAVTGGFVDWKGQRLLPPRRGMDGTRFAGLMERISDADLATYGRRGGLRGAIEQAAVDVDHNRPIIKNDDGSFSTERTITVEVSELNGGRPTNIPTIWQGKQLSDDDAVRRAISSKHTFPGFSTLDAAVAAAKERSERIGEARGEEAGIRPGVAPALDDGTPVSADMLRRYGRLQMLSPGRYAVVLDMLKPGAFVDGTAWRVRPKDGQGDYVLDLTDAVDAIEARQLPGGDRAGSSVMFGDTAERLRRAQQQAPGAPVGGAAAGGRVLDPAHRGRP